MRTCMNSDTPLAGGVVGAAGFEPTTFCAQSRSATTLRYTPPQGLLSPGLSTSAPGRSKAQFPVGKVAHVRPDPRGRPARTRPLDQCPGRRAAALLASAADRLLSRRLLQHRP